MPPPDRSVVQGFLFVCFGFAFCLVGFFFFFDWWLLREDPVHCGQYLPWAGGLGHYKKAGHRKKEKAHALLHCLYISSCFQVSALRSWPDLPGINPFLTRLLLIMVFYYSNRNPKTTANLHTSVTPLPSFIHFSTGSQSCSVVQGGLKLVILCFSLPNSWDYNGPKLWFRMLSIA